MLNLSIDLIRFATGARSSLATKYSPYFNSLMDTHKINTPERALAFLANVGQESGGLYYTEEIASGAAYEGRTDLGNIYPGDGVKYKGRGIIQLTGRDNYTRFAEFSGVDVVNNPELISTDPTLSVLAAVWFWSVNNLNEHADKMNVENDIDNKENYENFVKIVKEINGAIRPTTHLDTRISNWVKGRPPMLLWKFEENRKKKL